MGANALRFSSTYLDPAGPSLQVEGSPFDSPRLVGHRVRAWGSRGRRFKPAVPRAELPREPVQPYRRVIDPVATHLEIDAYRGRTGMDQRRSVGSAAGAPLAGTHQADANSG